MTQQQFQELKSLIQGNARQISRNYEMIGRIYEEHGGRLDGIDGRLTRVEVGQEQLSHDLRAVAEGVTGNTERLDRLETRFDGFEVNFHRLEGRFGGLEANFDHLGARFDGFEAHFDHLSASVTASHTDYEQRLRTLEG